MNKRSHSSVTQQPCECRYLEKMADDPDMPIVFDEETGEFQFRYDERLSRTEYLSRAIWKKTHHPQAMLVIYHCPFCGGAAPESKRHLLFNVIPRDEETRLAQLLQKVTSMKEAIEQLGPPDTDGHSAIKAPECDSSPNTIRHHRQIRYNKLSAVADVTITEREDGSVFWHLQGKYKGGRTTG